MKWQEVKIESHPLVGMKWVKVIAHIRKNETGEVRECCVHEILRDDEEFPSVFSWKENNFACDCNREIFFERAVDKDIETEKCSEGRFSVNLQNPVDGLFYYKEF